MFYIAVWKFDYKCVHNDLPSYFSAMKPTLPTVCRRYEIRSPMFYLPMIRHTFAEHSIRDCLINFSDTRSTSIMERFDTDPYHSTVCPEVEKIKMDNFLLFNIWEIYLVENTLNYHTKKKNKIIFSTF